MHTSFDNDCDRFRALLLPLPPAELVASTAPTLCPLERILISQQEISSASLVGQDSHSSPMSVSSFTNELNDVFVCVAGRDNLLISSSLGDKRHLSLPPDVGSVVCTVFATADSLVVCSAQGKVVLIDWRQSTKPVASHSLPAVVMEILPLSPSTFVCRTGDDALYLVKVLVDPSGRRIGHQLMIAPTPSLGSVSDIAIAGSFLLVAGSASVLILDMSTVEKPRVVFRLLRKGSKRDRVVWVSNTVAIVYGGEDSVILTKSPSGFDHSKCPHVPGSVVAVGASDVLILRDGDTLRVAQLTSGNLQTLSTGHRIPDLAEIAAAGHDIVSVSIKGKTASTVSVDVHRSQLVKWRELVMSQLHAERFGDAITLLLALKRGQIPSLLDDPAMLNEAAFIDPIIAKSIKSGDVPIAELVEFAATFAWLPKLIICASTSKNSPLPIVYETIVNMVVSGRLTPSLLTHDVVTGIVESSTSSTSHVTLDRFVAMVVLNGVESGNLLIDTNRVVRAVTAMDLPISVVLLHVFLLHDLLFPLRYWVSCGSMKEAYFYLSCVSRSVAYPTRSFAVTYPSDAVLELLQTEKSIAEKLLVADPELFLLAIGNRAVLMEDLRRAAGPHAELKSDVLLYSVRTAIQEGSISEFFSTNNKNDVIQILVNSGDIQTLLNVLDHVGGSVPNLEALFRQLVTSTKNDEAILKFATSFANDLDLELTLQLTGNDVGVKLLCLRGDFQRAVARVDSVELAAFVTQNYANLVEENDMLDMWNRVIADAEDVTKNACVLMSAVDCAKLASAVTNLGIKLQLLKIFNSSQDLIAHATAVSAIDVRNQFAQLAKHDSARNKAVAVTASMCHVCLDPVRNSKRNDVMLFSCGHLVHVACGDTAACPVCV